MRQRLDEILAEGGTWHAIIQGPDGEIIYERGSESVLHPASAIKTVIAMLILDWMEAQPGGIEKQLDSGPLHAGRSYRQLLQAMLVVSEEEAAQTLQDAAVEGLGWKRIGELLIEWGAPNTRLVPRRSTARDIAILLDGIYHNRLLSARASAIILDHMAAKTAGDTARIWRLANVLPPSAVIYNKRGSLTDPLIVADTGIVLLPDEGAYIICVFGYSNGDVIYEELDQRIGDFALAWYKLQFAD